MNYKPADLFMALTTGDYEVVQPIVKSGMDLNFRLRSQTPLYMAVCNNNVEITDLLLSQGADVNQTSNSFTRQNEPPLVAASRMGLHDLVQVLLRAPGLRINRCDFLGVGALYCAVRNSDSQMMTLLLDRNADINIGTTSMNCPLFYSVLHCREQIDIILMLLQHGCTRERFFNCRDDSVHILHSAIQMKKQKTLRLLLDAGFRGNFKENVAFRDLCLKWNKELADWMWHILINPLSLKTIAMISIRKALVQQHGNLRQKYINQLPVPEKLKNELGLVS